MIKSLYARFVRWLIGPVPDQPKWEKHVRRPNDAAAKADQERYFKAAIGAGSKAWIPYSLHPRPKSDAQMKIGPILVQCEWDAAEEVACAALLQNVPQPRLDLVFHSIEGLLATHPPKVVETPSGSAVDTGHLVLRFRILGVLELCSAAVRAADGV